MSTIDTAFLDSLRKRGFPKQYDERNAILLFGLFEARSKVPNGEVRKPGPQYPFRLIRTYCLSVYSEQFKAVETLVTQAFEDEAPVSLDTEKQHTTGTLWQRSFRAEYKQPQLLITPNFAQLLPGDETLLLTQDEMLLLTKTVHIPLVLPFCRGITAVMVATIFSAILPSLVVTKLGTVVTGSVVSANALLAVAGVGLLFYPVLYSVFQSRVIPQQWRLEARYSFSDIFMQGIKTFIILFFSITVGYSTMLEQQHLLRALTTGSVVGFFTTLMVNLKTLDQWQKADKVKIVMDLLKGFVYPTLTAFTVVEMLYQLSQTITNQNVVIVPKFMVAVMVAGGLENLLRKILQTLSAYVPDRTTIVSLFCSTDSETSSIEAMV